LIRFGMRRIVSQMEAPETISRLGLGRKPFFA
jgi:hypothetical protein